MACTTDFASRYGSRGSKERKRLDSSDSDWSDEICFSAIVNAGTRGGEFGIDTAPLVNTWVIKEFSQAVESRRLYYDGEFIDLGLFTLPGRPLAGVAFQFSLLAVDDSDESCHLTRLNHFAKFIHLDSGNGVQHCWTNVTAELLSGSSVVNFEDSKEKTGQELTFNSQYSGHSQEYISKAVDKCEPECDQASQEDFEVIATIKLGPNELINDDERFCVSCQAWPLNVLRAAVSKDGSLRIRISFQLCDIVRSIKSRDLICGIHGDGTSTSDFVIQAENKEFAVHKCILAAASSDFQRICSDESGGGVLDLTNVATAACVKAFIALLYFNKYDWIALEDVVVTDTLMLACRFKTEHVKDQLVVVIAKILCLENVLRILTAAIECDALRAKEACVAFLMKNRALVRGSDCLKSLLELAPEKDRMRVEFVRALFSQRFCRGARPSGSVAHRPGANSDPRFPHEEIAVSETWVIRHANTELTNGKLTGLSHTTRIYRQYGFESDGRPRTLQWQLSLHPWGHSIALCRQGAASFILNLSPSHGEYKVCWAYVDMNIVNAKDAVTRPVVQGRLVEFSKSKGLTVDEGWTAASLLQLSSNNSLCVTLKVRVVNINEVLGFNERMTSCASLTVDQLAEIVDPDDVRVVETWRIADAKEWLATGRARPELFKLEHQKYPRASWLVSLTRGSLKSGARSIISHYGRFGSGGGDVGHCWTYLSAELLVPPNKMGKMEAFDNVALGPNELTRSPQSAVNCEAWSQSVLQSAVHDDDTLRIRLSMKIFDVAKAIKSRDALRDLRRHNASCDFKLKVPNATFPVHKSVLAAASSEFRAKFGGVNYVTWDLTSISVGAPAVRAFLALIYCEVYDWESDQDVVATILGVLKLANEFKAEQIKDLMAAVVPKLLSKGNVLLILDATIASEAARAKEACCEFLLEHNRSAMESSECLRGLLEQSEEKDWARRAFIRSFFDNSSGDCYCRRLGCPRPSRRVSAENPGAPNQQVVNDTWVIKNAAEKLQKTKLSHEFEPTGQHVLPLTHSQSNRKFQLRLYPSGRNRKAEFEGFSSFSIFPHPQDLSEPESLMAYVGVRLEKGGVTTFAKDGDGQSKLLVEFTKSRGLLIEKAWPTAALRDAIREDNTVCVKIELQIVNVRDSLVCYEMTRAIYEQRAFSDFTLACEGESIKIHKCILAQRSQIFAAMLSSEMRESTQNCLDLTNATTVEGLRAFASAIYFLDSSKSVNGDVAFELVKLAHQYGVPDVKHEYDRKFAAHIDMENVLDVLSASKLYDLAYSQAACIRYLQANTIEFLKSKAWLDLTKNESRSEVRDALMADLLLWIAH